MEGKQGSSSRPQPKGKQRIDTKKIKDVDDLLITFSKRKSGIYKKTSELVTLCGAEVGVVIFSPSGKAFSFGHPSADSVVNKFFPDDEASKLSTTHPILEAFRSKKVEELNEYHNNLTDQVEDEKELRKALAKKMNGVPIVPRRSQKRQVVSEEYEEEEVDKCEVEEEEEDRPWWMAPLVGLSSEALEERYKSLQEIHNKVCSHIVKDRMTDDKVARSFSVGKGLNPFAAVVDGVGGGGYENQTNQLI